MATLTDQQLGKLRRESRKSIVGDRRSKLDMNKSFQALEDLFDLPATRNSMKSAVNTATGSKFTDREIDSMFKFFLKSRADRE